MSKKFWAENRVTGARWKPEKGKKQYSMMYDSGYLAVVTEDFYQYVAPLDAKEWRVVKAPNARDNRSDAEFNRLQGE